MKKMKKNKHILLLAAIFFMAQDIASMDLIRLSPEGNPVYDSLYSISVDFQDENTDSLMYYAESALTQAKSKIDSGWALIQIGKAYLIQGKSDSGFDYLNEARKIFLDEDDLAGLVSIYTTFGKAFSLYDNFDMAKKYYTKALYLKADELHADRELAVITFNLADVELRRNNLHRAEMYLNQLDSLYAGELKRDELFFKTKMANVDFLIMSEQIEKAEKILLELSKKENVPQKIKSDIYFSIGNLEYRKGNIEKAIEAIEEYLLNANSSKDSAETANNLLAFKILAGKDKEAIELYHKIIQIKTVQTDKIPCMINYAEALANLDSLNKARRVYEGIVDEMKDTESYRFVDYLPGLIDLIYKDDKEDKAEKYIDLAGFLPILNRKIEDKKAVRKAKSDKMMQLILLSDKEIEEREKRISAQKQTILTTVIGAILLFFAFLFALIEYRKAKRYNRTLEEGYRLMVEEASSRVRLLVQHIFDLDKEVPAIPAISARLKNDVKKVLDQFEELFKLLKNK